MIGAENFKENLSTPARLLEEVVRRYLSGRQVLDSRNELAQVQGEPELGAVIIVNFLAGIGNWGIIDGGEHARQVFKNDPSQFDNLLSLDPWWQKLYLQADGGQDRLVVEGRENNSKFSLKLRDQDKVIFKVVKNKNGLRIGKRQFPVDAPSGDLVPAIVSQLFRS